MLKPDTQFFVAVTCDGGYARQVNGLASMRKVLQETFFGPDKDFKNTSIDRRTEEHNRWANFMDIDNWGFNNADPMYWQETGEDYAIEVWIISGPPIEGGEGLY